MYVVGLPGGLGSGKSAATERFESLGITVVDADVISRIIVEPGRPALAAIADHFGEDILQSDGTLDRARLRTLVCNSPEERSWLEQLTHPLIGEEIVTQLTAAKSPYVMLSSPLLLETSQAQLTDLVIVVDVPVDVQVQRTMARAKESCKDFDAHAHGTQLAKLLQNGIPFVTSRPYIPPALFRRRALAWLLFHQGFR